MGNRIVRSIIPPKTKVAMLEYLFGDEGPKPYMSEEEVAKHLQYIQDKNVLELGAGGSTLYFSPLAKSYTSLEGHLLWYGFIHYILTFHKYNYPNTKILYSPYDIKNSDAKIKHITYLAAVDQILGNNKFDIIILDCPASIRFICAQMAYDNTDSNALIFWHEYYHHVTPEIQDYVSIHYDVIDTAPGLQKYDPEGKGNLAIMRKKE